MNKKLNNLFTALNYIKHSIILASVVTGCGSMSAFASVVGIPVGIGSSAVGLQNYSVTIGIKSINQKERKKQKTLWNSIASKN